MYSLLLDVQMVLVQRGLWKVWKLNGIFCISRVEPPDVTGCNVYIADFCYKRDTLLL